MLKINITYHTDDDTIQVDNNNHDESRIYRSLDWEDAIDYIYSLFGNIHPVQFNMAINDCEALEYTYQGVKRFMQSQGREAEDREREAEEYYEEEGLMLGSC